MLEGGAPGCACCPLCQPEARWGEIGVLIVNYTGVGFQYLPTDQMYRPLDLTPVPHVRGVIIAHRSAHALNRTQVHMYLFTCSTRYPGLRAILLCVLCAT